MLANRQYPTSPHLMMNAPGFEALPRRKRKAESQTNERLSKRMSMLNIERGGTRLYVPAENPIPGHAVQDSPFPPTFTPAANPLQFTSPTQYGGVTQDFSPAVAAAPGDTMQLDDTKHKIYIYDLDDELSSSETETDSDNGELVFLPEIEKHLLANRIPPRVLQNDDGELAGMQLVLYREPTSLTVPEELDSVRWAVLEARERLREQQRIRREDEDKIQTTPAEMMSRQIGGSEENTGDMNVDYDPDAMDLS